MNTEQTELGEGPVAVVDTCFGSNWSYAHGKPESRAVFKEQLADFQVTEELHVEVLLPETKRVRTHRHTR